MAGPFEPGLKLRGKLFAVTPDARYLVYGGAWDFSLRIFSLGEKGKTCRIPIRIFSISDPGSKRFRDLDPLPRQRILNKKIVSELSEI